MTVSWRRHFLLCPGILLVVVLVVGLCSACRKKHAEAADLKHTIVVTLPFQEWMVRTIAGSSLHVATLVPTEGDAESYDPSPADFLQLSEAPLFLRLRLSGNVEDKFLSSLSSGGAMKVADVSAGISRISGADSGHGEGSDPHFWYSLRDLQTVARNTCAALSETFPDKAATFRARCDSLIEALKSEDAAISEALKPLRGTAFLVWHPSLSYFARDYGLRQLFLEEHGRESSPARFKEKVDEVYRLRPPVMLVDNKAALDRARTFAMETGVPVREIPFGNPDVAHVIECVANSIVASTHTRASSPADPVTDSNR